MGEGTLGNMVPRRAVAAPHPELENFHQRLRWLPQTTPAATIASISPLE
jgi:hypothetical protein